MALSRLIWGMEDDPFPEIDFSQGVTAIGSIGNTHSFRIGNYFGSFDCSATDAPAYSQDQQYGAILIAPTPRFFGATTDVTFEALAYYQWRITGISNMSSLTGATAGTWNNFNVAGVDECTLQYTGGGAGSYTIEVKYLTTGVTVGTFTYTITE